jgi:hypothetical protein
MFLSNSSKNPAKMVLIRLLTSEFIYGLQYDHLRFGFSYDLNTSK